MAIERKEKVILPSSALLKIGEVAKRSGVGIEALRFYERSGLLGPPARTQSGYRMYEPEVLERLDFIKRAQVLGFSLDEIRQIITEKEGGQSPCEAVRDIVRQRLGELDEHMKEMRRVFLDKLQESYETYPALSAGDYDYRKIVSPFAAAVFDRCNGQRSRLVKEVERIREEREGRELPRSRPQGRRVLTPRDLRSPWAVNAR